MEKADFIKMDVEGHEADIFEASKSTAWEGCEMILEVGSPENAKRVFMHSKNLGLKIFSQKIGWNLVKRIDEMPINYKEGSIFVTTKETMWN
jgi:hypothetical protein